MNVLAIDTASARPGVSVASAGGVFDEPLPADRQASERLLPAIARCLDAAGLRLSDCARVAACAGPGSFTGIRVGLSTAWGLARGLGIEWEMVSTLEGIAEAGRGMGDPLTAVLDAGRGEFVLQAFSLEGVRARPLAAARRLPREDALASVDPGAIVSLPAGLLTPDGRAPLLPVSRAVALAVAREPRRQTSPGPGPGAIYARASAAEEKRGAP